MERLRHKRTASDPLSRCIDCTADLSCLFGDGCRPLGRRRVPFVLEPSLRREVVVRSWEGGIDRRVIHAKSHGVEEFPERLRGN